MGEISSNGEERAPTPAETADIVNAQIETHNIAPVEYQKFLLDKLARGEQQDERVAAEAEAELEALRHLYPYLREESIN